MQRFKKISLFLVFLTASASAEIKAPSSFINAFRLSGEIASPEITRIEQVLLPGKFRESESHRDGSRGIRGAEGLEAIQVRFEYSDLSDRTESVNRDIVLVNFPLDAFTSEELSEIHGASDFDFDWSGRRSERLKKLANRLISFSISLSTEKVFVVDRERSICYASDDALFNECEDLKFKEVEVKYHNLKFYRRT
jgi:hypothetical protein